MYLLLRESICLILHLNYGFGSLNFNFNLQFMILERNEYYFSFFIINKGLIFSLF